MESQGASTAVSMKEHSRGKWKLAHGRLHAVALVLNLLSFALAVGALKSPLVCVHYTEQEALFPQKCSSIFGGTQGLSIPQNFCWEKCNLSNVWYNIAVAGWLCQLANHFFDNYGGTECLRMRLHWNLKDIFRLKVPKWMTAAVDGFREVDLSYKVLKGLNGVSKMAAIVTLLELIIHRIPPVGRMSVSVRCYDDQHRIIEIDKTPERQVAASIALALAILCLFVTVCLLLRTKWVFEINVVLHDDAIQEVQQSHLLGNADFLCVSGLDLKNQKAVVSNDARQKEVVKRLQFEERPSVHNKRLTAEGRYRFRGGIAAILAMYILHTAWTSCWVCVRRISAPWSTTASEFGEALLLFGACGRPNGIGVLCFFAIWTTFFAGVLQLVLVVCARADSSRAVFQLKLLSMRTQKLLRYALAGIEKNSTIRSHVWIVPVQVSGEQAKTNENNLNILPATVAQHSAADDAWVVIAGMVYDVTDWMHVHPGGAQVIEEHAGKDITELWRKVHNCGQWSHPEDVAERVDEMTKSWNPGDRPVKKGIVCDIGDCETDGPVQCSNNGFIARVRSDRRTRRDWRRSSAAVDVKLISRDAKICEGWARDLTCGSRAPTVCIEIDLASVRPQRSQLTAPPCALLQPLLQSGASKPSQKVRQIVPEQFIEGAFELDIDLGDAAAWSWLCKVSLVLAICLVILDLAMFCCDSGNRRLSSCGQVEAGSCEQLDETSAIDFRFSQGPCLALGGLVLLSVVFLYWDAASIM